MGVMMGLSPAAGAGAVGSGTPIYGAPVRVDVVGENGEIFQQGDWQYSIVGYVTPFSLGSTFVPQNPAQVLDEGGKFHLNRAFGDASTAIARPARGSNPCRDFFMQGRTPEEVNAIFKNFWNSVTYDPRLSDPASTRNSNQGMAASVRVGPSFFINKEPVYDWSHVNNMYLEIETQLTPRQYRALIILHEFAHALGRIPRDGPAFDKTGQQSLKNTQTMFEKCRRQLEGLPLD